MIVWSDLSEEEKDKIITLIQENYPEFFLSRSIQYCLF